MDDKSVLRMMRNIMTTPEGSELLDYLTVLSVKNYQSFKSDDASMNEVHKGYAIAIDSLIHSLEFSTKEKEEHTPVTDF